MTPIYLGAAFAIGFILGIAMQRYYLMKRIKLEILNNTLLHTAWKRSFNSFELLEAVEAELAIFRKERAAAEQLVKRELHTRMKGV